KKAELENIQLQDLLSSSPEGGPRPAPLRLSSEADTSANDTSRDTTDASKDTSHDATDIEARVNTAPRRKPQDPTTTKKPAKSKRKLFTQKEPELQTSDDESDNETTAGPTILQPSKLTQRNRKDLAQAERMARILMGTAKSTQANKNTAGTQFNKPPRFVLTGMSRNERLEAWQAIKQLHGKVQQHVDRKTTHVIMGSCHEPENEPLTTITRQSPRTPKRLIHLTMCNKCNSPGKILSKMFSTKVTVEDYPKKDKNDKSVVCNCDYNEISGVKNISDISPGDNNLVFPVELRSNHNNIINLNSDKNNDVGRKNTQSFDILGPDTANGQNHDIFGSDREVIDNHDELGPEREISQNNNLYPTTEQSHNRLENVVKSKPRTVNALLGAARGCRVLRFEWITDSLRANRWLQHIGYEVRHLKKISQRARVERSALNKMRSDYAYNVFNGMRVKISPDADQRDAITQLLTLCGATIYDGDQQNPEKSLNKDKEKRTPNNQKKGKNNRNGAKIKFSHLIALIHKQDGGQKDQMTQSDRRLGAQTQIQDGGPIAAGFDLTVGKATGEVSSKWVFDSVAAARMRTTRRYIND
ncbi:jg26178, partial [Pararge aegeria aegeria]